AIAAKMINFMSATASAFTIMFLFWTITRIAGKLYKSEPGKNLAQDWIILGAGFVGSMACTFTDTLWFNAVEGEVYALSSFFTSLVFWCILKWDEEDDRNPVSALRWIVLICLLIGISIGVHLLSLLTIPAMVFVIYFKKFKTSRKGFIITGIISIALLYGIQDLLIPKLVKFLSDYEVFFTNKIHFPFGSGTLIFFLFLILSLASIIIYSVSGKEKFYKIGFYSAIVLSIFAILSAASAGGMFTRLIFLSAVIYALHKYKAKIVILNGVFMSFSMLLIGYSSFFVLIIRSQANTPMDENDPENATNLLSYLLREQYEQQPLLYGQYYNAPTRPVSEFGDLDPLYVKDEKKGNYRVLDERKHSKVKYEKEFCTLFPRMWSNQRQYEAGYKYWGNVDQHHRTKVTEGRDGQPEQVEIPTMAANLIYFFRYQINYMYLRYFYWNYVGRQNDFQGLGNNNTDGNWVSGIKFIDDFKLDTDTSQKLYRFKNNFGENHYYALPLLLGLCGLFFHFKKDKKKAWIVLCFFIMTGIAIVVFLNQQPSQPRERDYAYPGSFYAFSIWIGLGVIFIFEQISKKQKTVRMAILAILLCLIVPGLMAKEGWNDHNRSQRTMSRDFAADYLRSCAPNAILFTNGDNDTFPLWYAQEVEGIRTDIRVVCLSLLSTDWHIKQLRRAAYEGKPAPFSIPQEKVEGEKMQYAMVDHRTQIPMSISEALIAIMNENPSTKLDNGFGLIDIIPTDSFYMDVDKGTVLKNNVVSAKDSARITKRMTWNLGGKNYLTKSEIMMLDVIAHNNWERPIYFTAMSDDVTLGLAKYLQAEGLTYRLVPIEQNQDEINRGGRVNTTVMYDNIMNKFEWGGMNKKGIYLDETCLGMAGNMRMQMIMLAEGLIAEGEKEKAKLVLQKCLKEIPDENVPFDVRIYSMCVAFYELGDLQMARKLSKKLFDVYENDLKFYIVQKPNRRNAYLSDIRQAKAILKNLTLVAQHYQQDDLVNEFTTRLQPLLGPEDLEEKNAQQVIP
ncbi:MAG: DUF2723 domain-containing protein, partial [Bacteroidia bacterium]|nr:DUF2723 domain-containing protein [Bacteroidia bacterium]